MIKILIVDDHGIVRDSLRELLARVEDIEVVGEAADGEQAVKQVELLQPDVVLMDVKMPLVSGIKATKKIKEKGLPARVLMLTVHEEEDFVVQAIREGAAGYLSKNVRKDELVRAIRAVFNGESYIYPSLAQGLIKGLTAPEEPEAKLSQREIEVLQLMSEGLSNKEVARKLFLSVPTVKSHVENIFRKMNVNDRTQAVVLAMKRQLIR